MASETLFIYWNQSLELFHKNNFKLFLLGVLNSWLQAFKRLEIRFFWLFGLWGTLFWFASTSSSIGIAQMIGLPIGSLIIRGLILYVMIASLRPSMEQKNYAYYLKYLSYSWVPAGLIFFVDMPQLLPVVVLTVLFFFDGPNSLYGLVEAFARALKATLSFLPVITIFALVLTTMHMFFALDLSSMFIAYNSIGGFIAAGILLLLEDIIFLLMLSLLTVYYIKIKHAHYDLLFG